MFANTYFKLSGICLGLHIVVMITGIYSPPQSRSFVYLLPLITLIILIESRTSERLCQIRDASEDTLCISKDIVSLKAKFTTGSHKILHRGQ